MSRIHGYNGPNQFAQLNKQKALRYAIALCEGRLDVEGPTNAAIIQEFISGLKDILTTTQTSCLMCGHQKEPSTQNMMCGCFICVDCAYQRNGYIDMVNIAAQERQRAIQLEAEQKPDKS